MSVTFKTGSLMRCCKILYSFQKDFKASTSAPVEPLSLSQKSIVSYGAFTNLLIRSDQNVCPHQKNKALRGAVFDAYRERWGGRLRFLKKCFIS